MFIENDFESVSKRRCVGDEDARPFLLQPCRQLFEKLALLRWLFLFFVISITGVLCGFIQRNEPIGIKLFFGHIEQSIIYIFEEDHVAAQTGASVIARLDLN